MSSPARDVRGLGVAQLDQTGRRQFQLEAAPSGADVYRLVLGNASVDERRQFAPLAERADSADDVTGRALRVARRRHFGALRARGGGERFEIELGRHRYQRDDEACAVELRDERLVDPFAVDAERVRGFEAVA